MEQANPEEMELGKGAVDLVEESENKDLELQEDSADFNPLLKAALIGDTEEVQHIFEDSEDPDNDKATEFLKVTDVVGRSLLYTTCMSGQSDVIRTMARYGVDLKETTVRGYTLLHCAAAWGQLETLRTLIELEADIYATTFRGEKARDIAYRYNKTECVEFLDWAEAKQNLRNFISQIQATITDPEKVQGRLNKEDKNTSLKACQAKSDWLESIKEPTMEDFLDQKQQLEEIMLPIFTKLATPRGQDSVVNKKIGNPSVPCFGNRFFPKR
ncbi:ankyrin repeat domain-containing protein 45 isoform X3 [Pogona vitticeps]